MNFIALVLRRFGMERLAARMKEGHKLAAYGLWLVTEENYVLYDVFEGFGAPRGGGRMRPDTVQSLREASGVLVVG